MGNSRFKFRAWCRDKMTLITGFTDHYVFFDDQGLLQTIQGDMKLMQFTGLKDSKGVEIYDGDVVSIDKNSALGIDFNLGSILTVGFFNGCFCGYIKNADTVDARPMNLLRDIEVIGNIHENPELLEATK